MQDQTAVRHLSCRGISSAAAPWATFSKRMMKPWMLCCGKKYFQENYRIRRNLWRGSDAKQNSLLPSTSGDCFIYSFGRQEGEPTSPCSGVPEDLFLTLIRSNSAWKVAGDRHHSSMRSCSICCIQERSCAPRCEAQQHSVLTKIKHVKMWISALRLRKMHRLASPGTEFLEPPVSWPRNSTIAHGRSTRRHLFARDHLLLHALWKLPSKPSPQSKW